MENMSYMALSRRLAGRITERAGLPPEKETVLAYAVEVLAINLGDLLLTLGLAALLGVLPGVTAGLIVAVLFRHTAGGAHSDSPWRCAAVTIAVYPTMALMAAYLARFGPTFIDILSAFAVVTGFVAFAYLAPVDSPKAPIISGHRRRKLKILSLLIMALVAAAIALLRQAGWDFAGPVRACLGLVILWASLMLGRPGHRLMGAINAIKIKRR